MKLNKKLLIFVLSLCLLVGVFALAAFAAEGDADVLTIRYQNGTVQTYKEGDEVVPPAVPKEFIVYDEEGLAYKFTTENGAIWQGLPRYVTKDHLGQTLNSTVAGTQDPRQIYYITEEKIGDVTTVVYHMVNALGQYISKSNTGDRGDGSNTGAASYDMMFPADATQPKATSLKIILYSDLEISSFAAAAPSSVSLYLDLNGHTLTNKQSSFISAEYVIFRIYSSRPGAHWYQTASSAIIRPDDGAKIYLGDISAAGANAANISFHCKSVVGDQWGSGSYIYGGKYYQTADGAFFNISRRIHAISNAEFYVRAGQAVFSDSAAHDDSSIAAGTAVIQNCKFYSPTFSSLISASQAAKPVFDNCAFFNVKVDKSQGSAVLNFRSNCVSCLGSTDTYGTDNIVFAKAAPYAYAGLIAADGSPISATVNYVMAAAEDTLQIITEQSNAYYMIGAPFSNEAGDGVKIENGKLYAVPKYDLSEVYQIENGIVVDTGKAQIELIYTVEDIPAFTYFDTRANKLYAAGYVYHCGGTPEGVFEKFYEIFNSPASAYEITMYMDMTVTKSIGFGAFIESRTYNQDGSLKENRDYYSSLTNGSIVWDLNGKTITVAKNCTTIDIYAVNKNNYPTVFGLEGSSKNVLTVTSSKAGAKIINNSAASLFGVGEGSSPCLSIQGENLTVKSASSIFFGINSLNGAKHFEINGGLYIYEGAAQPFSLSGTGDIVKNATILCTAEKVSQIFGYDQYRKNVYTIENCIIVAPEAAKLFGAKSSAGSNFAGSAVTVKDCVLLGITPALKITSTAKAGTVTEGLVTYDGVNVFSDEDKLAIAYPEAPEGSAKYLFEVGVLNAEGEIELVSAYGYATADQFLTVTYPEGLVKNYLLGKYFIPIAMDSSYYTVIFDLENGTVNIPVAWAGIPAEGIITEAGAVTATPADNYIPLAFALYDAVEDKVVSYDLADSSAIFLALEEALSNQENAGKLYVFADLAVGSLSVATELEVLLGEYVLTLDGALAVSAPLTVQGGEILSAEANPFALSGSAVVTLNETAVYLSDATVVFSGSEGTVALSDVAIFNLGNAALVENLAAVVNGAKLMGVSLGATVTVDGTVLGTAGTFNGCAYANGVISGVKVNNFLENVVILGESYEIAYVCAATNDASLVVNVTYQYEGINRATEKYYKNSIASFYSVFAPGYYFSYQGESILTEDVTVSCLFTADASKLQAQLVLSESLAFTFYLQVEEAGVLENLAIGGKAINLASLNIKNIDGVDFYVIPVVFDSFTDALNDMVLTVDLVNEDTYMTITATAALDEYFAEIFEAGEEVASMQAYAAMDYVCALADYFDYSFSFGDARGVNLGRLYNMLAKYEAYKTEADLPSVNTALASAYIESVLLVAKEKITFAFRVADDFEGTVLVNGVEQAVSQPFAGFDRDYVLAEVAFADLDEVITVTVKGANGETLETVEYTLADYVAGVAVQNEGVTAAYAKALWNLAAVIG